MMASSPPDKEGVLVCVGASPTSARLIRGTHRLASSLDVPWVAVSVEAPDAYPMGLEDRERLLAHLRLAESLGAEVVRLVGRRVSEEIITFAQQNGITKIIIGKPTLRRWREVFTGSMVNDLLRNSGEIEIHFIPGDLAPPSAIRQVVSRQQVGWSEYFIGLFLVVVTTLLAYLAGSFLSPPDTVMLYLLPIMWTAFRSGQKPAMWVAALAVAAYDFFFVPPFYTFNVYDFRYVLTFAIMFAVGIAISSLMIRIRRQEHDARSREYRTAALHHLGRDLLMAEHEEQVAGLLAHHVSRVFGGEAVVLLLEGDQLPTSMGLDSMEMELARWSCLHLQPAGRGTVHQPERLITCMPLTTTQALGVLVLRSTPLETFTVEHGGFLEAFVRQGSLAVDRARLSEKAKVSAVRMKTEEMRSSLLSMASHDLRTPLAAITGAGSALREEGERLDGEQKMELLETICSEAERMERLIGNLLDMVKVEGGCTPRCEWVPVEEVLGSVITRLEGRCQGRQVTIEGEEEVVLIYVDPVLFEQVLFNLMENALKYTPPATAIVWRVAAGNGALIIALRDFGSGIPAGEEEVIFEKFSRCHGRQVGGAGLGLAICRGIVDAHGGTIVAHGAEGGGAEFVVSLPQPPFPDDLLVTREEIT